MFHFELKVRTYTTVDRRAAGDKRANGKKHTAGADGEQVRHVWGSCDCNQILRTSSGRSVKQQSCPSNMGSTSPEHPYIDVFICAFKVNLR